MFRISEQTKDKRKDVPKFGTKGEEHETICDRKFKGRRWENNNSGESGIQYGKVRQKVLVLDADPQTNLTPFFIKVNANGHTIKTVLQHQTWCAVPFTGHDMQTSTSLKGVQI